VCGLEQLPHVCQQDLLVRPIADGGYLLLLVLLEVALPFVESAFLRHEC
jgi:hypothetical protein